MLWGEGRGEVGILWEVWGRQVPWWRGLGKEFSHHHRYQEQAQSTLVDHCATSKKPQAGVRTNCSNRERLDAPLATFWS